MTKTIKLRLQEDMYQRFKQLADDFLSLVSRNLEKWESNEDEEFGKSLQPVLSSFREFLTLGVSKVVKICALNLMNLVKNTLVHFGITKIFLLLGRFMKPSAQKLSWENTYREMAACDEDWSDWDAVINDGLDDSKMRAKIQEVCGYCR